MNITIVDVVTQPDVEKENLKAEYEYRRKRLIRPGSVVTPTKNIIFSNKTAHMPGFVYNVTEDNISYFVVNLQDYRILSY